MSRINLLLLLVLPLLQGPDALAAKLIFKEDFEDGKIDAPLAQDAGSGARIVSTADGASTYSGQRCLRGNFKVGYTDPITKTAATSRYTGISVDLKGVSKFYFSLRYRLDPTNQWVMDDPGSTALGYKFFYLMGTPWNNTLNWVLAQLWGPDHWWMGDNQPTSNTGYTVKINTSAAHAKLGVWHLIEIFAELNSAPGAKNGKFMLRIDGTTYINVTDLPYQTTTTQKFGSLGGVPHMYGGCCGAKYSFGWQIDDVELWDDLPGTAPAADAGAPKDAAVIKSDLTPIKKDLGLVKKDFGPVSPDLGPAKKDLGGARAEASTAAIDAAMSGREAGPGGPEAGPVADAPTGAPDLPVVDTGATPARPGEDGCSCALASPGPGLGSALLWMLSLLALRRRQRTL